MLKDQHILFAILFLIIGSCKDTDAPTVKNDYEILSITSSSEIKEIKGQLDISIAEGRIGDENDLISKANWEFVLKFDDDIYGYTAYAVNINQNNEVDNLLIFDKNDSLYAYHMTIEHSTPTGEIALRPFTINSSGRSLMSTGPCVLDGVIWVAQECTEIQEGPCEAEAVTTIGVYPIFVYECGGGGGTGGEGPLTPESPGGGRGGEPPIIPTVEEVCSLNSGGLVLDQEGNDVCAIPCDNDPLIDMEISDYNNGKNSNRFGCVRVEIGATCDNWPDTRRHSGIDLQADYGTTVFSPVDGIVYAAVEDNATFGNFVIIQSGNLFYLFAHLEEALLVTGPVSAGEAIGTSGDSGNASGQPHLHFEVRQQLGTESYNNMIKLNPEDYLGTEFDNNGNNIDDECTS